MAISSRRMCWSPLTVFPNWWISAPRACLRADTGPGGEVTRVMLTPRYASPEQKRGEGPSVSGDIYSSGRLLEEMSACGRRTLGSALHSRSGDGGTTSRPLLVGARLLEDLRRLREGLPLPRASGHGRVRGAALPAQKLGRGVARRTTGALAGRRMVAGRAGFAPRVRRRGRGMASTPGRGRE